VKPLREDGHVPNHWQCTPQVAAPDSVSRQCSDTQFANQRLAAWNVGHCQIPGWAIVAIVTSIGKLPLDRTECIASNVRVDAPWQQIEAQGRETSPPLEIAFAQGIMRESL
jgi:hypothetical protein